MIITVRTFALFAALSCGAIPLLAHHSFGAEYDANKPVTLTGTVTKIEWTNPHSHFFLDVKDDKGNVANWKFEGYPPSVLYRTGWKREVTMKVGDTVTVFRLAGAGWYELGAFAGDHCSRRQEAVLWTTRGHWRWGKYAGSGRAGWGGKMRSRGAVWIALRRCCVCPPSPRRRTSLGRPTASRILQGSGRAAARGTETGKKRTPVWA